MQSQELKIWNSVKCFYSKMDVNTFRLAKHVPLRVKISQQPKLSCKAETDIARPMYLKMSSSTSFTFEIF